MKQQFKNAIDKIKISENFIEETAEKMKGARKPKIQWVKYTSVAAAVLVISAIAIVGTSYHNNSLDNYNALMIKNDDFYSSDDSTAGSNLTNDETLKTSEMQESDPEEEVKVTDNIINPETASGSEKVQTQEQKEIEADEAPQKNSNTESGTVNAETEIVQDNQTMKPESDKINKDEKMESIEMDSTDKTVDRDIEAIFPTNRLNFSISSGYKDIHEAVWDIRSLNPVNNDFYKAVNGFSARSSAAVLADSNGNSNFSPISLYYVISMIASGAEGENKQELMNALGMSDIGTDLMSSQSGNLFKRLVIDYPLEIANSVWINKAALNGASIGFKESFVKNMLNNFFTSVFREDFSNSEADKKMNGWVIKNTSGKLNPNFDHSGNYQDFIMSIVNTITFNGEWEYKFDPSLNTIEEFNTGDKKVKCEFMNAYYENSWFYEGDGYKKVVLGLEGTEMSFYLPDDGVDVHSIISSEKKVTDILAKNSEKDVYANITLKLPKFAFESKNDDLADQMRKLGINLAFDRDIDINKFSGITEDVPLFISKIEQGTYIGINERGVEASAYTNADLTAGSGIELDMPVPVDITIKFDKPFIYTITTKDGIVLFVGIVKNPLEG